MASKSVERDTLHNSNIVVELIRRHDPFGAEWVPIHWLVIQL